MKKDTNHTKDPERLDIVQLITNSPLTTLSQGFHSALIERVKTSFTDDEQRLFVASFYSYLNYNSKNDFVISLDDIWKWCGFGRKSDAKRVLNKHFIIDTDYIVFAPQVAVAKFVPQDEEENENRGGHNKEKILMTVNTFKKFCLKAGTKRADEIHDYYIKLEELLQDTLREQLQEQERVLQEKEQEIRNQQSLLEEKDKEIGELENYRDKTYEEIEKLQHVYVIKMDGGIKVGKTKDQVNKRIRGMQTANVGDIQILMDFKTHNADLLERCVHYVLDRYRCNSNREFFNCKKEFILETVFIIGTTLNTLKSSFQTITSIDLKEKLYNKLNIEYEGNQIIENDLPHYDEEVREFYTWLDNKLYYKKNSITTLKTICENFLNHFESFYFVKFYFIYIL